MKICTTIKHFKDDEVNQFNIGLLQSVLFYCDLILIIETLKKKISLCFAIIL